MEKKKIFVEIALPPQVQKRIANKIEKWRDLPVKWTKSANLHLTVAFVGYVDESVIPEICDKVCRAVESLEMFDVDFDMIHLAPDANDPRLVLLSGKASESLRILNEKVEQALGILSQHHKEYSPHVTVGRIRKQKWKMMKDAPQISEKLSVSVSIESVSVMENSHSGEYLVLEECPLA